jgi:hypothetical protein
MRVDNRATTVCGLITTSIGYSTSFDGVRSIYYDDYVAHIINRSYVTPATYADTMWASNS